MNEHCAMGLNRKGVTIFVILLILFWPVCWLPWIMKDTKAEKPVPPPNAKPRKSLIVLAAMFFGGVILFSVVLTMALRLAGVDTKAMVEENKRKQAQVQAKWEADTQYAKGYRAGYALLKPSGKILNDGKGSFKHKLADINRVMDNIDETVENLAFDYGGNKSKAWKDGCKEGVMDGVRNAKAKH
jgi:hypothetical protein